MEAATKQIEERKKQLSFASSVPAAPVIKLIFSYFKTSRLNMLKNVSSD